jgi:hypothetical protein
VKTYAIPDAVEFSGEWHLPGATEGLRISGQLTWKEARATLTLHDSFSKPQGAIYGSEKIEYPAIYGQSTNSELISVLQGHRSRFSLNFGSAGVREPETVTSSWVVVGAHVTRDATYQELRVRIPGLELWIGHRGATRSISDRTADRSFTVVYTIKGTPEEITNVPGAALELGWGIDRQFSGDLLSHINVSSSAWLRIKPDEPKPLDDLFAEMGKAITLLSFLSGSPMAPDRVTAKLAEVDCSVQVLIGLRASKRCTYTQSSDFFLLRASMGADLGEILARWYALYDQIAMPSQLALAVLSSDDLWLHVEFLSLMQALEGLHRALLPGHYVSEEEYGPIAAALTAAIPSSTRPDHRDSLKSRIRYGNQHSLRRRLDALVSQVNLPIRQMILGRDGTVPRSWTDTRNFYTHWDETLRSSTLEGLEMHRACVRMKLLLRVLYLKLVGISDESILSSLRGTCAESQYLLQLNAADHRERNPGSTEGVIATVQIKDARSPNPSSA